VVVDTQQAQEHLLGQILNISRPMPQARREKPPQPLAVLLLDVRDERLLVAELQVVSQRYAQLPIV
jgi:hypothetical protein